MKISEKIAIASIILGGILCLYGLRVAERRITNKQKIVVVTTEQQAKEQAHNWWKAKVPSKVWEEKSVGMVRSYLLNGQIFYEIGYTEESGTDVITGGGYSWDGAFVTAINDGFLPVCCEGVVDWDKTNKYLKALGKPEYKKIPR